MATKKKKTTSKKSITKKVKATKKSSKKTKAVKSKKVSRKITAKKKVKKAAPKKVKKKVTAKKTVTKKVSPQATPTKKVKALAPLAQTTGPSPYLNTEAPDLTLNNQNGVSFNLRELSNKTKNFILYFYPKDDTPGCTKEACNFRDNLNRLQEKNTVVVGVSPDDAESHQKFIDKFQINFDLLSDSDKSLANHYGVWKEKEFMGNKYWGVERSTFLFENGKVKRVWQPVKVDGHVDEVLSLLSE